MSGYKSGMMCPMPKRTLVPERMWQRLLILSRKNCKVFAHITKCLFYVIKSNKVEPGNIARSLMNTPRHFSVIMTLVATGV